MLRSRESEVDLMRMMCLAFGQLTLIGAVLAGSTTAYALGCRADADCPLGFQCLGGDQSSLGTCISSSCTSDSDCGAGLRCQQLIQSCGADSGAAESCKPKTMCVPQWQAPC